MLTWARNKLAEYGVFASPIDEPFLRKSMRGFLVLCAITFLSGPAIDLLAAPFVDGRPAFFTTSFVNLFFAALALGMYFNEARLSLAFMASVVSVTAVLVGIPYIHFAGGATTPAVLFLAVPIVLGTFFLSFVQGIAVFATVFLAWLGLYIFELTIQAPPVPANGVSVLNIMFGFSGFLTVWTVAAGFFGAHRHSEQKRSEVLVELAHRSDRLERAMGVREAFLQAVGHELRTPLAAIVGLTEVAHQGNRGLGPDESRRLHGNAVHLLNTIENLLDIARARSGDFQINSDVHDVAALVRDTADLYRPVGDSAELIYDVQVSGIEDGDRFLVDAEKLRRILGNLISNALHATAAGRITIRTESRNGDDRLFLVVEDTGSGFDPGKQMMAADSGLNKDGIHSGPGTGMGLGLRLVEQMVEAMDGMLTIESAGGDGTRVTVDLPVERCQRQGDDRQYSDNNPAVDAAVSLLIVDDNPDILEMLRLYCDSFGWLARTCTTPEQALATLADPANAINVVVMDILMPGTDGIEGLKLVRQARGPNLPVVALTAHVREDALRKLRDEGFAAILSKPLGMLEFQHGIEGVLPD